MDDEDMDARIYRISEYEYAIRNRTEMKNGKESKEHKSKKTGFLFGHKESPKLVPGSHGMNVPSTCTIVIIAGKLRQLNLLP